MSRKRKRVDIVPVPKLFYFSSLGKDISSLIHGFVIGQYIISNQDEWKRQHELSYEVVLNQLFRVTRGIFWFLHVTWRFKTQDDNIRIASQYKAAREFQWRIAETGWMQERQIKRLKVAERLSTLRKRKRVNPFK